VSQFLYTNEPMCIGSSNSFIVVCFVLYVLCVLYAAFQANKVVYKWVRGQCVLMFFFVTAVPIEPSAEEAHSVYFRQFPFGNNQMLSF